MQRGQIRAQCHQFTQVQYTTTEQDPTKKGYIIHNGCNGVLKKVYIVWKQTYSGVKHGFTPK